MEANRAVFGVKNNVNQEIKWSMRSLRGCESQTYRAASTHPLSSPTSEQVGESHESFVEKID